MSPADKSGDRWRRCGDSDSRNMPWAMAVARNESRVRKLKSRGKTGRSTRSYRGRYVYAWFNCDSSLPFYIGKGTEGRAWAPHTDDAGQSMPCQIARVSSAGFRVDIVRDNLTEEGARLLESALIRFVHLLGGDLRNQVAGMSRQERPPLELDAPEQGARQGPQDRVSGQSGRADARRDVSAPNRGSEVIL